MKLSLKEIVVACDAKLIKGSETNDLYGFSTDTRTIKTGEIYIPLKGESFDGENFIENALSSGANGYFTANKKMFLTMPILFFWLMIQKKHI